MNSSDQLDRVHVTLQDFAAPTCSPRRQQERIVLDCKADMRCTAGRLWRGQDLQAAGERNRMGCGN